MEVRVKFVHHKSLMEKSGYAYSENWNEVNCGWCLQQREIEKELEQLKRKTEFNKEKQE